MFIPNFENTVETLVLLTKAKNFTPKPYRASSQPKGRFARGQRSAEGARRSAVPSFRQPKGKGKSRGRR